MPLFCGGFSLDKSLCLPYDSRVFPSDSGGALSRGSPGRVKAVTVDLGPLHGSGGPG